MISYEQSAIIIPPSNYTVVEMQDTNNRASSMFCFYENVGFFILHSYWKWWDNGTIYITCPVGLEVNTYSFSWNEKQHGSLIVIDKYLGYFDLIQLHEKHRQEFKWGST